MQRKKKKLVTKREGKSNKMDIELEKEKTGAWRSRRHSTDQAVTLREKGILSKIG